MPIFPRIDPDTKAQKDVEAALRAKLVERLGIAEAGNYKAKARQLAASGGDDTATGAAGARMRECADRAVTLTGAVADTDAAIVELEAQIEAIIDNDAGSKRRLPSMRWAIGSHARKRTSTRPRSNWKPPRKRR